MRLLSREVPEETIIRTSLYVITNKYRFKFITTSIFYIHVILVYCGLKIVICRDKKTGVKTRFDVESHRQNSETHKSFFLTLLYLTNHFRSNFTFPSRTQIKYGEIGRTRHRSLYIVLSLRYQYRDLPFCGGPVIGTVPFVTVY